MWASQSSPVCLHHTRDAQLLGECRFPWQHERDRRGGNGFGTCRQPEVRIKMRNVGRGAPIEVLFEDEHIWVINKPTGLQSTTPRFGGPSVILSARTRSGDAHLVHRLDRDTSGVMVVGLSRWALKSLNRQFRERSVLKRYEALVRQGASVYHP